MPRARCANALQYKVALVAFRLQFPAMFDKTSTAAMNLMTGLGVLYIFLSLVIATQLPGAWPTVFTVMAMFVWLIKTCACWPCHTEGEAIAACVACSHCRFAVAVPVSCRRPCAPAGENSVEGKRPALGPAATEACP